MTLAGTAALAVTLAACERYGAQGGGGDTGAVTKAIKADEKKMNDQFKANDLEGLVGHYADDAYFVAPGLKPADGAMAIRKAFADALTDQNFAVSFGADKVEVASSGDFAYTRGRFTEKSTDPKTQKVVSQSGSYLTVYKKQPDGSWKVVEDFTASDPAPPAPVQPGKAVTHAKMISGIG
jgi:ketosteroid isomerase-like protein